MSGSFLGGGTNSLGHLLGGLGGWAQDKSGYYNQMIGQSQGLAYYSAAQQLAGEFISSGGIVTPKPAKPKRFLDELQAEMEAWLA